MLCECCHARVATNHITIIIEGNQQERHLCPACAGLPLGSNVPPALIASQRCEFCGDSASIETVGSRAPRFWCNPCAEEYRQILQEIREGTPEPTDPQAMAGWADETVEEADRRMKARRPDKR